MTLVPAAGKNSLTYASTGLHCAQVKMMAMPQNIVLPIIETHIRNAFRHLLSPMNLMINSDTEIFPVAKGMIAKGWVIQLILMALIACAGSISR